MTSLLLVTHCFPANANDLVGNFLYDFCLSLKAIHPKLIITVFTPKMVSEYDHQYLSLAADRVEHFSWLGGKKRLAELKPKSINDLLQLASIFYHGKKCLKKLLESNDFDFVLAPWVIPNGYYIASLSKKFNIPFALWALGSDLNVYGKKPLLKNMISAAYRNCTLSYTNSRAMQLLIEQKYRQKSSLLFTNRRLPLPQNEYRESQVLRLVFVGRLESVKGPDLLLEAIMLSGIQDYRLEFIGDGSLMSSLQMAVKSNKLQNKILFHGQQNGSFIAEKLKSADYLVISSLAEGMPVVFWEAMQSGTPVISTDVGDVKYYCDSYNVGRVCAVNAKELGEMISFIGQFKVLRAVLSKNTAFLAQISDIQNSACLFLEDVDKIIQLKKNDSNY